MPWWFKAINKAWKVTYPLGTRVRLEKDELIKAARNKTGLKYFGGYPWEEPFDKLLWSLNNEANLHPVGYFITRKRLVSMLSIRLRVEKLLKDHPEILEQKLYPAWAITGLQRTGTTKMHRLLASDPDNRVLLSWEALDPLPAANGKDRRIKDARMSEMALRIMAPGFFAIHPVEYNAPEEDVLLLDNTFMSQTFEATTHVPSYSLWLESQDHTPAYEYYVRFLKILQWQRPAKRWILKTPHHMEYLQELNAHVPDLRVIWMHRDPYESIPSFLSMILHSRTIFSDRVNISDVTKHWVRKSGVMLEKAMEFRKRANNKSIIHDVEYMDFVTDSIEVLHKLYKSVGGVNIELEEKFRKSEMENPPGKYGVHKYSLEEFGIGREDIDVRTVRYRELILN